MKIKNHMESKNFLILVILFALLAGGALLYQRHYGEGDRGAETAQVASVREEKTAETAGQELAVEILEQGVGAEAKNGDGVAVHYVGSLEDGAQFDSSLERGQPFIFTLGEGEVIRGWDLGVLGMKTGEKRRLIIPSELAYGPAGIPGRILPNSTLIFEVQMIAIYPAL